MFLIVEEENFIKNRLLLCFDLLSYATNTDMMETLNIIYLISNFFRIKKRDKYFNTASHLHSL